MTSVWTDLDTLTLPLICERDEGCGSCVVAVHGARKREAARSTATLLPEEWEECLRTQCERHADPFGSDEII